jgi:hypothetical protein
MVTMGIVFFIILFIAVTVVITCLIHSLNKLYPPTNVWDTLFVIGGWVALVMVAFGICGSAICWILEMGPNEETTSCPYFSSIHIRLRQRP